MCLGAGNKCLRLLCIVLMARMGVGLQRYLNFVLMV